MSLSTAGHKSSRKRLKMSSTNGEPSPHSGVPHDTDGATPANTLTVGSSSSPKPCQHAEALKTLSTDIDAMRQLVTCKVCAQLLYEPYALSCGHTYCYSCMAQWLGSNRKMTCPDCRTTIHQEPTPSYIVRELVLVFVSRTELLPEGETSEEHNKNAREEAAIVTKDRANADPRTGGLFKGRFKKARPNVFSFRDHEDGVDRCPECNWELEDPYYCERCHIPVNEADGLASFSDMDDESDESDESDEELDHELDIQDAGAFADVHGGVGMLDDNGAELRIRNVQRRLRRPQDPEQRHHHVHPRRSVREIETWTDSESDDLDEEADSSMEGFIDDEDIDESLRPSELSGDESEDAQARSAAIAHVLGRGPPIHSHDDEEPWRSETIRSESYQTSDDEGTIEPRRRTDKRQTRTLTRHRRMIVVSSDEESEDDNPDPGVFHTTAIRHDGTSARHGSVPSSSVEPEWTSDEEGTERESSLAPVYDREQSDDETEESEDDDFSTGGWGTPNETPRNERAPPAPANHRLHTLGHHSNRHTSLQRPRAGTPHSMTGPQSRRGTGRASYHLPSHPFQLDGTLSNINNYNQRTQRVRTTDITHPFAANRGPAVGGAGGQTGIASGSAGPALARRTAGHKRILSISSDDA